MHSVFPEKLLWSVVVAAWLSAGVAAGPHRSACPHAGSASGEAAPSHEASPGAGHHQTGHTDAPQDDAPAPCHCSGAWCCPATLVAPPAARALVVRVGAPVALVAVAPARLAAPPRPQVFAVPLPQPPPSVL